MYVCLSSTWTTSKSDRPISQLTHPKLPRIRSFGANSCPKFGFCILDITNIQNADVGLPGCWGRTCRPLTERNSGRRRFQKLGAGRSKRGNWKKNTTWEWIMAEVESESLVNFLDLCRKKLEVHSFWTTHTKVVLASDWSWSLRQNGLYHKLSEVGGLA